jgi:SAM-dependent methyltransferase
VDPSAKFVDSVRSRLPGVSVLQAHAEALPFAEDAFDVTLAQLVVHFMSDPVGGLSEMRRVTRPGGVVAACVWDHAGGSGPLEPFWRVARRLDPGQHDESERAGTREGHLAELFAAAGLREVRSGSVSVTVQHASFEEWWEPFVDGVGPAGSYVVSLPPERRARLREECLASLGKGPLTIAARAWAAAGRA